MLCFNVLEGAISKRNGLNRERIGAKMEDIRRREIKSTTAHESPLSSLQTGGTWTYFQEPRSPRLPLRRLCRLEEVWTQYQVQGSRETTVVARTRCSERRSRDVGFGKSHRNPVSRSQREVQVVQWGPTKRVSR